MPRRRKITIQASELECFETLVRELQQRPEFAGFDPSSLHVWAYERPTLDRWIANGWLEPCRVQISSSGDTLFAANAVREVLERFR